MVTQSIQNLKGEMSITEKEILFWFNHISNLEKEHDRLEKDIFNNHSQRLEEIELEMAAILKRMRREKAGLEVFRQKYNKEAKKRKMQLIN